MRYTSLHTFPGSISRSSPQLCRLGPTGGMDIIFWISKNLFPLLAIQPQSSNPMPSCCVLILRILQAFFIKWFISRKCSYFASNSLWGGGRRWGETLLYYQTASTARQLLFSEQHCNWLRTVWKINHIFIMHTHETDVIFWCSRYSQPVIVP